MKLNLKQEQEILDTYKGQSLRKHSKEIGYDSRTIKRVLEKHNIDRRFATKNKDIKKQIVEEYKKGKGSITIEKEYNVNWATVLNYVREAGVEVRDLKDTYRVGNNVNSRKHKYNQDYFENIDSEGKAYWLGFIYADGSIATNSKGKQRALSIMLKASDKNHLEKFKQCIQWSGEVKVRTLFTQGMNRDYAVVSITNKKLVADLANWGVEPRKTFTTKFPYNIPSKFYKDFIRGYFDGDGCLGKTGDRLSAIGTFDFLSDLMNIYCKENPSITKTKLTQTKSDRMFTLNKGGRHQAKLLADYLYKDASIYLDRKYQIYLDKYC